MFERAFCQLVFHVLPDLPAVSFIAVCGVAWLLICFTCPFVLCAQKPTATQKQPPPPLPSCLCVEVRLSLALRKPEEHLLQTWLRDDEVCDGAGRGHGGHYTEQGGEARVQAQEHALAASEGLCVRQETSRTHTHTIHDLARMFPLSNAGHM